MPPPPLPEFLPWPHLGAPPPPPPPPPPCWSLPQVACVPGMPTQAPPPADVVPHGAMAMAPPSGQAPGSWPRRHPKAPRKQRVAGPAPAATAVASCGVKSAADAKEAAATNQPSPRSVLAVAVPSPPISPTTSLPTSFPYQLVLPTAPPADAAGVAYTAAPSHAEGSVAIIRPPQRPRRRPRGPRRARPASRAHVRHAVKPRRLFDPNSERTSLMIRNIPNDFTRMRLMNILDEHCFIENEKIEPGGVRSEYDFLYLPIDFRTLANKGYAFVNMTSPEAARRLWADLDRHRWAFKRSGKTCAVDYADRQGRDPLVEHFSGSRFDCHTEEYLPVRFEPPRDGTRPAEGAVHVVGRLAARPRPRPHAGDGK
ncbi:hypothetical protein BDA96_02G288700 [Sorghum bicolor]|uniref:RRM domain-containing protein n=3 Tax=Sorghum bicolor TaxID=4558 RepID=A0A921RQ85_SORBI|nr:hypothetical protein BDA96_02G288700 [Sorghum bicolor]OQU89813.1 hypothetical protein SORBI_3002G274400 [Sorghum bicolor]